MASRGGSDGRAVGLGGGDSPPRPRIFRTEVEQRKWKKSEGALKRSARRWTNWGLTPPGKLARFTNQGEGSSFGQSSRAPRLPMAASSKEDDLIPARSPTFSSGDYGRACRCNYLLASISRTL
jgi:hypothetical protein